MSHRLICGSAGTGKTFLTSMLIEDLIANKQQVFVLDAFNEYHNLVRLFEGTHIQPIKAYITDTLLTLPYSSEKENVDYLYSYLQFAINRSFSTQETEQIQLFLASFLDKNHFPLPFHALANDMRKHGPICSKIMYEDILFKGNFISRFDFAPTSLLHSFDFSTYNSISYTLFQQSLLSLIWAIINAVKDEKNDVFIVVEQPPCENASFKKLIEMLSASEVYQHIHFIFVVQGFTDTLTDILPLIDEVYLMHQSHNSVQFLTDTFKLSTEDAASLSSLSQGEFIKISDNNTTVARIPYKSYMK